jgi:hypothetical protein
MRSDEWIVRIRGNGQGPKSGRLTRYSPRSGRIRQSKGPSAFPNATALRWVCRQATAGTTPCSTATGVAPREVAESTASKVARTMLASMPTPKTGAESPTRTSR